MNAFLSIADMQMANPVKAKVRAAERRAEKRADVLPTPAEAALAERNKLTQLYRAHIARRWDDAVAGPYGAHLQDLKRSLARFGAADIEAFIAHVEGLGWAKAADLDTRLLVFRLIVDRVARIRAGEGLHPMDDALPHEPDCAVILARRFILGR